MRNEEDLFMKMFDLTQNTKNRFVTPLILEFYEMTLRQTNPISEDLALEYLKLKYKSYANKTGKTKMAEGVRD